MRNGSVFDSFGVNFSEVYGKFDKKFRNQKNQILAFIAGSSSFVSTSAIAKAVGASLTTVGARVSELRSDFGVNFKTVDVNVNGSNQTAYSL